MTDNPYKKQINPKKKALVLIFFLLIVGFILGIALARGSYSRALDRIQSVDPELELESSAVASHNFGIIVISIVIILLFALIVVYINVFRKTKSQFILGLLFFLCPLVIRSIIALPVIHSLLVVSSVTLSTTRELFGVSSEGFGAVVVIYFLFEIGAMSILLYLSME
jgi:hypothetical protein